MSSIEFSVVEVNRRRILHFLFPLLSSPTLADVQSFFLLGCLDMWLVDAPVASLISCKLLFLLAIVADFSLSLFLLFKLRQTSILDMSAGERGGGGGVWVRADQFGLQFCWW